MMLRNSHRSQITLDRTRYRGRLPGSHGSRGFAVRTPIASTNVGSILSSAVRSDRQPGFPIPRKEGDAHTHTRPHAHKHTRYASQPKSRCFVCAWVRCETGMLLLLSPLRPIGVRFPTPGEWPKWKKMVVSFAGARMPCSLYAHGRIVCW